MGLTEESSWLLISGSKVRVLARPPLFLNVLNWLEGQLCAPPLAGVRIGNALSNVYVRVRSRRDPMGRRRVE